jgi:Zn-dependent peptidase ImmA (M78 family)
MKTIKTGPVMAPNYKMIELARLARGYTQKELASLLPNLNQPNLSKVEKGLLIVMPETLKAISKVLDFPTEFFYLEELKTPISNIYFRKRSTIPQKTLDKVFTDVKIILKSIDLLLAEIELKEYDRYSFDLSNGWTPEAAAIRMREIMRIPAGPVKDIVTLIENEGVVVYFYDSPHEKFDGLTSYTDKGIPVIIVNKNMPNDRIRFTIIHEFAHLVLHIPCNVEPWRNVETEAHNFAGEFLIPKLDCRFDLQSLSFNKLSVLKAYWGVSKAAIIVRAKVLSLINEASYVYLMKELGRRNERKVEGGYVEIDDPKILKQVISLLKSELSYTEQDIAGSLFLTVQDYLKYFENKEIVKVRLIKSAV